MSASVDWDRLAEYVAGLLDGTPDAERIAHLIESDAQWARAHDEMCAAHSLVVADLAALSSTPEPMPPDVIARLEGAITAEERVGSRTVVSLDAARRRRKRWTVIGAVAAGVAALALLGPPILTGAISGGWTATDPANSGAGFAKEAPAAPQESGLIVLASGTDYRRDTLGAVRPNSGTGFGVDRGVDKVVPPSARTPIAAELARLNIPAARQECLRTLVVRYGGRAASVDYARFEGIPALVVVLVDGNARPNRIVAAGTGCGVGGDSEVLYSAVVGG